MFSFSDETGMWVRVSTFTHRDPAMPSITLLPMIHIGEKDYFREMACEMWLHDLAYMEGCYMPARKLFHLFHRSLSRFNGLSLQSGKLKLWKKWKQEPKTQGQTGLTEAIRTTGCDCGSCHYDELPTIRADLHRWHALKAFKAIPLWVKLTFPFLIIAAICAAPFLNFRDYAFGDDDEDCDCEKCKGNEGPDFLDHLAAPFKKFMIEDRDLFLRMVLAEEVLRPARKGKRLCVKYGAKHMPVLAETFLQDFGYELAHQRDVLAVKKTKAMDVSGIATGYGLANERYWGEVDARRAKVKEVITDLTGTDYGQIISVQVSQDETPTPMSFAVQTDLSGFVGSLTPASTA